MTHEAIETEYWAVHYAKQDPNSKTEEFENDDFEEDLAAFEQMAAEQSRHQEKEQDPSYPDDWENI